MYESSSFTYPDTKRDETKRGTTDTVTTRDSSAIFSKNNLNNKGKWNYV